MGHSRHIEKRLKTYRHPPSLICTPSAITKDGQFWLLGTLPGTWADEQAFHNANVDSRYWQTEWYRPKSRGYALLLLRPWNKPELGLPLPVGSGPLFELAHHRTASQLASLLSQSRKHKRGAKRAPKPCNFCGLEFGVVAMRKHLPECPAKIDRRLRPVYPCEFCTESFTRSAMAVHMRIVHARSMSGKYVHLRTPKYLP